MQTLGSRSKIVSYRGTWIETCCCDVRNAITTSYLIEVRGLKQYAYTKTTYEKKSYLIEVRGLKPFTCIRFILRLQVASFTGAWIETWMMTC